MNPKTIVYPVVILLLMVFDAGERIALADDPKARSIMEKVDVRDDGDNQVADMQMILIDKKGKKGFARYGHSAKTEGQIPSN